MSQNAQPSTTPAVRGFQLDASAIGDLAQSLNLYRGEVNFPLTLVRLPGPNGLDLKLEAFYSSNVTQQVDTWNLEAPTGVLGLGWSLPFDFISFTGSGTASFLEGRFLAHLDGRTEELVLITWTERGTPAEELTFASPTRALWQFFYKPAEEKWTVRRDDGIIMTFGDPSLSGNAVQWGVRWGNWVGSSTEDQAGPERFGLAWNLAEVRDPWNNTIRYSYEAEEETVVGRFKATRASCLSKVVDSYGRTVELSYGSKDRHEYQPPHTRNGQAPGGAFQDRYETRYLQQIDVASPEGELYYSLVVDSQPKDLGETTAGSDELTDTCKRYLFSVTQERHGQNLLPPILFHYDLKKDSISRGLLKQVDYPAGGSAHWSYINKPLGDREIFALDYTAERPTGYKLAEPRLWFGPDYVIIGWKAHYGGKLLLQVFEYGGRWTESPYTKEIDIDVASVDDVYLAFGSDFFAFYAHGSGYDSFYIFQKTRYQFGNWTLYKYDEIQSEAGDVDETALVAGTDFVALHPGGTLQLYHFTFDRRSWTWSPQPGEPLQSFSATSKTALAAAGNVLAVGSFDGDDTVTAKDQMYYLDIDGKGALKWNKAFDTPSSHGPFNWDKSYVSSYMRLGSGFAVSTWPGAHDQTRLHVIQWQRNFAAFEDHFREGDPLDDGLPKPTLVSGSTIANGGHLYRYDGSRWSPTKESEWTSKSVAVSADMVVAAKLDDPNPEPQGSYFDPLADAWDGIAVSVPPGQKLPSGPQFVGRFLTLGANLLYHNTDDTLRNVCVLQHTDGKTIACHGPVYVAYENSIGESTQRSTYVALLKNGAVDGEPTLLPEQRIGQPTGTGTMLTGPTAFATYDSAYDSFTKVPKFTLHRILNRQVGDSPKAFLEACIVEALEKGADQDWPQEVSTWRTRYTYDGDGEEPCALGRLTRTSSQQESGQVVEETFAYDFAGNVVKRTSALPGKTPVPVTYEYDHVGNVTQSELPSLSGADALRVSRQYDARGLLLAIGKPGAAADFYGSFEYNAAAAVETEILGEGTGGAITRSYRYTSEGWLASIEDELMKEHLFYHDPPQPCQSPRYDGLLSGRTYERTADALKETWCYGYDDLGRLETAKVIDGDPFTYRYDANGNLRSRVDGPRTTSFIYQEGTDLLSEVTINEGGPGDQARKVHYTPSGELQAFSPWTFEYDFVSGLTTGITDLEAGRKAARQTRGVEGQIEGLTLTYGSGVQRLLKEWTKGAGSTSRRYVPGADDLPVTERHVGDVNDRSRELRYIYGPSGLVGVELDGSPLVALRDHEQSIRVLLAGKSAAPLAVLDYDPFGGLRHTAGSDPAALSYRYTGQEWDDEVGLYNFRHRLYDPGTCRFTTPDPARQYASPYVYVGDHPLMLVDPTGEFSFSGFITSVAETAVGVALVSTGVGAFWGTALVAAGAAGINYSARTEHFSWKQWAQVEGAAAASAAEIHIGLAIEFGTEGAGYAAGAGALTGAGFSGLTNTFKQINQHPDSFDWGEWGSEQISGAISGALSGGIGKGLGSTVTRGVASASGEIVAGKVVPSLASQVVGGIAGKGIGGLASGFAGTLAKSGFDAAFHGRRWNVGQAFEQALLAGSTGALKGAVFGGLSPLGGKAFGKVKSLVGRKPSGANTSSAAESLKKLGISGGTLAVRFGASMAWTFLLHKE